MTDNRTNEPTTEQVIAERDAALAAIERVAALHVESDWKCGNPHHTNPDIGCPECYTECETCDRTYPCDTRAALDGAPEPEWEYGLLNPQAPDGGKLRGGAHLISDSREHILKQQQRGHSSIQAVRRRKAGPWVPVESVEEA